MIVEVNVPVFAESITEGTLLKWYKKVGDSVARDETLVDIETDKVVLEVPAPQAGVLVEIVVQDGETVTTQQLLAKIDTAAVAMQAAPAEIQAASAAPALIPPPAHKRPLFRLPRLLPKPLMRPRLPQTTKLALPCPPPPNSPPKKAWT